VVSARDSHLGALRIVVGDLGQRRQLGFRGVAASLDAAEFGRQQVGVETGAELAGGVHQPLGEREVVPPAGRGGGGEHQVRVAAAADQPPAADPQDVFVVGAAAGFDRFSQCARHRRHTQDRQAGAHHVAVDGVTEPNLKVTVVDLRAKQARAFQSLGDVRVAEGVELALAKGLAEAHQLHQLALVGA
jgi:hypothetical protein